MSPPPAAAPGDRGNEGSLPIDLTQQPTPASRLQTLGAFEERRGDHRTFVNWVRDFLAETFEDAGIDVAWIEGRAKGLNSYALKLLYGREFRTTSLEDFTALRVITYFEADKNAVVKRLEELLGDENCKADDSNERINQLEAWEFAYRTRHVRCRVPARLEPDPSTMAGIWFELQVRTISEHAWASVDHKLRYKGATPLDREQARTLFRAAAMLENVDNDFDDLYLAITRHLTGDGNRARRGRYTTSVTLETIRVMLANDGEVTQALLSAADAGWVFTNPTPAVLDDLISAGDEVEDACRDLAELCDVLRIETIAELKTKFLEATGHIGMLKALLELFAVNRLDPTGCVPDFMALMLTATHDLPIRTPYRLWSETLLQLNEKVQETNLGDTGQNIPGKDWKTT